MNKKILTLAILGVLSTSVLAQDPRNSDIKVTADIQAGCFLTADNLNFGVLAMPLSDQSTQSSIRVKCSNGANLSLSIDYSGQGGYNPNGFSGEISVVKSGPHGIIFINGERMPLDNSYKDYDFACDHGGVGKGMIRIYNNNLLKSLGYTEKEPSPNFEGDYVDKIGICNLDDQNFDANKVIGAIQGGNSGSLNGLTSGESINYFISLPNESTVWNFGNKYTLNGNGSEQVIPMKANIKRADNPTHRLTPDTYQSNLNVVLDY